MFQQLHRARRRRIRATQPVGQAGGRHEALGLQLQLLLELAKPCTIVYHADDESDAQRKYSPLIRVIQHHLLVHWSCSRNNIVISKPSSSGVIFTIIAIIFVIVI